MSQSMCTAREGGIPCSGHAVQRPLMTRCEYHGDSSAERHPTFVVCGTKLGGGIHCPYEPTCVPHYTLCGPHHLARSLEEDDTFAGKKAILLTS